MLDTSIEQGSVAGCDKNIINIDHDYDGGTLNVSNKERRVVAWGAKTEIKQGGTEFVKPGSGGWQWFRLPKYISILLDASNSFETLWPLSSLGHHLCQNDFTARSTTHLNLCHLICHLTGFPSFEKEIHFLFQSTCIGLYWVNQSIPKIISYPCLEFWGCLWTGNLVVSNSNLRTEHQLPFSDL